LPESSLDNATQRGVRKTRLRQALSRSIGMYMRRESQPSRLLRHTLDELRRLGRERQVS
jgi:hypothetical protein